MNEHTTPDPASASAPDLTAFLAHDDAAGSGRDTLARLGPDGVDRLLRRIEADFAQALSGQPLSGRDLARVAALGSLLAADAGISEQDGRDALVRLLALGWTMGRWYGSE